jgi:hypothetical protein
MLSIPPLSAVVALSLLPLLAACQEPTASASVAPERPVQVQRVAFANGDAAREFVGVVRARYETDLGFRVAGKITARAVNVGDQVRIGDVIARLDPQDLKLQVRPSLPPPRPTSRRPRPTSSVTIRSNRAATLRSPTSSARHRPRTKRRGASNARGARSISRAISSITPT